MGWVGEMLEAVNLHLEGKGVRITTGTIVHKQDAVRQVCKRVIVGQMGYPLFILFARRYVGKDPNVVC